MNIGKATCDTHIQTIIRLELCLNTLQINQNNYTLSTFSLSNQRNSEDSGKVLAASVSEFLIARVLPMLLRLLLFMLSLLCVYK